MSLPGRGLVIDEENHKRIPDKQKLSVHLWVHIWGWGAT